MTLEDIAYDIESVIYTLGLKEVNLLGNSLGGLVALKFMHVFSGVIKRLVLVDFLPKFVRSKDYPYGLEATSIQQLKSQLQVDYPIMLNVFFRSLFTIQERRQCRIVWLQQFKREDDIPNQEALQEYLDILTKEDLREALGKIDIPVLLINGTEDYICSKEAVYFVKKNIPKSQVHLFKGCGHFPF